MGVTAGRVNVLLVTIDTLRWDHLGCYGDRSAATPVLDALAGRGVRFATAIAHVPLTAPSHASILTGLTPLRHGVRDNGGYTLPAEVRTLARRLADAGYRSAAFVSGFPLDHRFGFASGFDVYDDRLARTAGRAPYTERSADATTDRAIAWLDRMRAVRRRAAFDAFPAVVRVGPLLRSARTIRTAAAVRGAFCQSPVRWRGGVRGRANRPVARPSGTFR